MSLNSELITKSAEVIELPRRDTEDDWAVMRLDDDLEILVDCD